MSLHSRCLLTLGFCTLLLACATTGCKQKNATTGGPNAGSKKPSEATSIASIEHAKSSLDAGQIVQAQQQIQQVLLANPNDTVALELAGDIAVRTGQNTKAAELYQTAFDQSDIPPVALVNKLGAQYMTIGRPFDSIRILQSALQSHGENAQLRQTTVGMMASVALQQQALEHLQWLVQHGHGAPNLLIILSNLNRPQTKKETCTFALKTYPDDLRPAYGLARLDAYDGKWQTVRDQLAPVVNKHPDFLPAQALYLRALVEVQDDEAVGKWIADPPAGIETEPDYWIAAGIWADRNESFDQAAGAFYQAVRRDENNEDSLSRLARSLKLIGHDEDAILAAERAKKLIVLRDAMDKFFSWRGDSQTAVIPISKSLLDLGRPWEATVWLQAAFQMSQQPDPRLPDLYQSVRSNLTGTTPWQQAEYLVSDKIDGSQFPDIAWNMESISQSPDMLTIEPSSIRWTDRADELGLRHVCSIQKPAGVESNIAIYQTGAGGAGVIDFDLDGHPDVHLTKIDGRPRQRDSSPNRLYRNDGKGFVDVTDRCGAGDTGFSQGVTIGDYNADGFPDVLIGNIGSNRLYRNNGDGTFDDVTMKVGLSDDDWTTSTAMADLDGDSLTDLFQVAYCAGDAPLQQQCIDKTIGEPRSCTPIAFDAQRDRVWKGNAEGTFTDVTDHWLTDHLPGFGLGIVVGQFDGDTGLDTYVANDTVANHYWSRDAKTDDGFRLGESATIRGLALSDQSAAQASMGIAVGDADSDGDVDFFVTHFTDDHATFYEQVRVGMWADRTRIAGIFQPTYPMLAFGTQWIDADNDGSAELLVANGHIDDLTHDGQAFRMPPQLFDRTANGKWVELPGAEIGDYFQSERLGRAVANLDANSDGKTDALITHLYDPVALLINETDSLAQSVRLFLRGTRCERDAIGTIVQYQVAGQSGSEQQQTAQLFAGDGYQCTNEKCITIGTHDADKITDVSVRWPDQSETKFQSLRAGHDYLIVQGDPEPFELATHRGNARQD
ncbi:MAG: RNA-binding protein [Pirellulaceae bacterium]|nr:RNA-binding protein [Pirellulaceae bacterium]